MKISVQMTMVFAAIFTAICLSVAVTGFTSLGDIGDPTELADAKGFAWFWTFLGSVASAFGVLAWWIARTQTEDDDA